MRRSIILLVILIMGLIPNHSFGQKVIVIPVKQEIGPRVTRLIDKGIIKAKAEEVDLILLDMNTYGGLVTDADSIRISLLNSTIQTAVFINKNAASAGALISLACDDIYMQPGSSIGAATVVTQDGAAAPDKFQSYMRGLMRSTAEAKGKIENGKYKRNPKIAEAMVDENLVVQGISKKGEVLTFTVNEALKNGFCDKQLNSIEEVLDEKGLHKAEVIYIKESTLDVIVGWLLNPAVRGILIAGIIFGLYFEIQSPGLGIPSLAAISAALLYFAPAYLEGLAANWEIILFLIGVLLILIELLVIPGFGVAGIGGIILCVASLVLAALGNLSPVSFQPIDFTNLFVTFATLFIIIILFMLYLLINSSPKSSFNLFRSITHNENLKSAHSQATPAEFKDLIGLKATVVNECKPEGKVLINGRRYNAKSLQGAIKVGVQIKIVNSQQNYIIVSKTV